VAYFANFSPASFALICEGTMLQYKLNRLVGINGGILWAAVRAIERGEATCSAFTGLSTQQIERTYTGLLRVDNPRGRRSPEEIEHHHSYNALIGLPPQPPDVRVLDSSRPVTPTSLLELNLSAFNYTHGVNQPLKDVGLDVPRVCDLLWRDGFQPEDSLNRRGTIPEMNRPLYDLACEKAQAVASWLVCRIHVLAAAVELRWNSGDFDPPAASLEWEQMVARSRERLRAAMGTCWCCPGPRPWAPSACRLLGVESAVGDILGEQDLTNG
jgi:hypothetical protein